VHNTALGDDAIDSSENESIGDFEAVGGSNSSGDDDDEENIDGDGEFGSDSPRAPSVVSTSSSTNPSPAKPQLVHNSHSNLTPSKPTIGRLFKRMDNQSSLQQLSDILELLGSINVPMGRSLDFASDGTGLSGNGTPSVSEGELSELNLSDDGTEITDNSLSNSTCTSNPSSPAHSSIIANTSSSPTIASPSSPNFMSRLSSPKSLSSSRSFGKERPKDSVQEWGGVSENDKKITLQEALNLLEAEESQ